MNIIISIINSKPSFDAINPLPPIVANPESKIEVITNNFDKLINKNVIMYPLFFSNKLVTVRNF